jgi:hypothetical protein
MWPPGSLVLIVSRTHFSRCVQDSVYLLCIRLVSLAIRKVKTFMNGEDPLARHHQIAACEKANQVLTEEIWWRRWSWHTPRKSPSNINRQVLTRGREKGDPRTPGEGTSRWQTSCSGGSWNGWPRIEAMTSSYRWPLSHQWLKGLRKFSLTHLYYSHLRSRKAKPCFKTRLLNWEQHEHVGIPPHLGLC